MGQLYRKWSQVRDMEDAECFLYRAVRYEGVREPAPQVEEYYKSSKWEGLEAGTEAKRQVWLKPREKGAGQSRRALEWIFELGSNWRFLSSGVTWLKIFRVTKFKKHSSMWTSDRDGEKGDLLAIAVICVRDDGWWWWRVVMGDQILDICWR